MRRIAFLFIISILLFNCERKLERCDFGDLEYPKAFPQFETIEGVYQLDSTSFIDIGIKKEYEFRKPLLFLFSPTDGKKKFGLFIFKNIPYVCFDPEGLSKGRVFDFIGNYQLTQNGRNRSIENEYYVSLVYFNQKATRAGAQSLKIMYSKGKPVIVFEVDKYENCNYLAYRKIRPIYKSEYPHLKDVYKQIDDAKELEE